MELSKVINRYLEKHGIEINVPLMPLDQDTEIIVVVPVHNESKFLPYLFESLSFTADPGCHTRFIFVVNDSIDSDLNAKRSNDQCIKQLNEFHTTDHMSISVIEVRDISSKHAGVGLARKTGMDVAAELFMETDFDGLIVCLDADCTVAQNYLSALRKGMNDFPKALGFAIHFEHPLDGQNKERIIEYELHLRYFIDIQKRIGLPYAIQTVGSSMAVRASAYASYGGMNKRQAGEDFYFLQKFISVGGVVELNTTCVFPSDRSSDRVPFGTGKAISDMLERGEGFYTYQIESFSIISEFIEAVKINCSPLQISQIENSIKPVLLNYLKTINWKEKLIEIESNTKGKAAFLKRFFQWFNAFMLMKCLHYLRDNGYPNKPVGEVVEAYLSTALKHKVLEKHDMLRYMRELFVLNSDDTNIIKPLLMQGGPDF